MTANNLTNTLRLKDGRTLVYAEYGFRKGRPVLYCHGNPGCRFDPQLLDHEIYQRAGVRLIAPDRPGIGQSDFQPGRAVRDWPVDLAELADALHLERFAVLSLSAGSPFAVAAAADARLVGRITSLGIVSGLSPLDAPGSQVGMGASRGYFRMARRFPLLARLQFRLLATGLRREPEKTLRQVEATLPPPDRAVMADPRVRQAFCKLLQEAMHSGPRGMIYDAGLLDRPWDPRPEAVQTPARLWHGEADTNAPAGMGRRLAEAIPGCQARFFPGEGHFSLAVHHFEEILNELD